MFSHILSTCWAYTQHISNYEYCTHIDHMLAREYCTAYWKQSEQCMRSSIVEPNGKHTAEINGWYIANTHIDSIWQPDRSAMSYIGGWNTYMFSHILSTCWAYTQQISNYQNSPHINHMLAIKYCRAYWKQSEQCMFSSIVEPCGKHIADMNRWYVTDTHMVSIWQPDRSTMSEYKWQECIHVLPYLVHMLSIYITYI